MSTKYFLEKFSLVTELPCLEIYDGVILPGETGVVEVERNDNISAVHYAEATQQSDKFVICVSRDSNNKWNSYGVVSRIINVLVFNDSRLKIMLQPLFRVNVSNPYRSQDKSCLLGKLESLPAEDVAHKRLKVLLKKSWSSYISAARGKASGADDKFIKIDYIEDLAFRMAGHLISLSTEERESLLNSSSAEELVKATVILIEREKEFCLVEEELNESIRKEMDKDNKDYAREKKLKILQKELGGAANVDMFEMAQKIEALPLTENNRKKVNSELKKLEYLHQSSPEYSLTMHYLNWVLYIPWGRLKQTEPIITKAEKILNRDHYGLEKTKERVLESLAVQLRTGDVSGNILCLMGPPGVGKTSIGQSIADATGRTFVRIALGGVKDEAEIRGHRKTYIGSMPGKIVNAIKNAGNLNPCILLDEIDKISSDFRGDPSSALLEVLDPEQNFRFNDHFMDLDIDLSKVLFVATANSYDIPSPLLDRMEVIELTGYTELEKIAIAQKYLIPKSLRKHGLSKDELKLNKSSLVHMIRHYTREAGVRELERTIDKVSRKRVRELLEKREYNAGLSPNELPKYLGVIQFTDEPSLKKSMIGVSQGLAWTSSGGAMLSIETALFPGQGKLIKTGSLGDVMQESIQAAISVVRSIGGKHKFDDEFFDNNDLHIHLPEGATPKDGPSAGITLCTAIVSLITKIPVRMDVAMTGEINLRGEVLEIGGLKEKLLAALQCNIKEVIIPKENARQLDEIPAEVKSGLKLHAVENINQVLDIALSKTLTRNSWPKKKKKTEDKK